METEESGELTAVDILTLYLSARLQMADREYTDSLRRYGIQKDVYTERRMLWCRNQVAAIKICLRDVASWEKIVTRYVNELEQSSQTSPQESISSVPDANLPESKPNLGDTSTVIPVE